MNKLEELKKYRKALIVVDMINGFLREGVLHDSEIGLIIPRQIELIRDNQSNNNLTVFIKDTHSIDAEEFKRFGNTKHCVIGSSESELVDELKSFESKPNTISILKNSTSYMEAPMFRDLISKLVNLNEVDVIGCCTDICVFNGTMGLANYFDEWNRDVTINVHTDAIATYSQNERQEYVDASKLLMSQQGIRLIKK